jgi:hypothetical protein
MIYESMQHVTRLKSYLLKSLLGDYQCTENDYFSLFYNSEHSFVSRMTEAES